MYLVAALPKHGNVSGKGKTFREKRDLIAGIFIDKGRTRHIFMLQRGVCQTKSNSTTLVEILQQFKL